MDVDLLTRATERLQREQLAKLWRKLEDLNTAIQFSEMATEMRHQSQQHSFYISNSPFGQSGQSG